jgi:hypothetical protein
MAEAALAAIEASFRNAVAATEQARTLFII